MDKELAVKTIEWLIRNEIIVSPQYARTLYTLAEIPIPKHLEPPKISKEFAEMLDRAFLEGVPNHLTENK